MLIFFIFDKIIEMSRIFNNVEGTHARKYKQ